MSSKLYMAPVSSQDLFKNYEKTVQKGIPRERFPFKTILSSDQKETTLRIWGVSEKRATPYYRTKIGDYLVFYHKGKIVGGAKIIYLVRSQSASEWLWGSFYDLRTAKDMYWEYLLFLGDFIELDMDYKILNEIAGYEPKATVRGYRELPSIGHIRLKSQFGTIPDFLGKYKVSKKE